MAAAFAAGLAAICGKVPALAEEGQAQIQPEQACGGDEIARGAVRRILDGRTFVLDDGCEVRLAAIEVPTPAGPQDAAFAPKASAALDALAGGDEVVMRRAETGSDRYGRLFAYAYIVRDDDQFLFLLQQELIADGFARVGVRIASTCSGDLLSRGKSCPRGQAWPMGRSVL